MTASLFFYCISFHHIFAIFSPSSSKGHQAAPPQNHQPTHALLEPLRRGRRRRDTTNLLQHAQNPVTSFPLRQVPKPRRLPVDIASHIHQLPKRVFVFGIEQDLTDFHCDGYSFISKSFKTLHCQAQHDTGCLIWFRNGCR